MSINSKHLVASLKRLMCFSRTPLLNTASMYLSRFTDISYKENMKIKAVLQQ